MNQKNSEYGHFLRSVELFVIWVAGDEPLK